MLRSALHALATHFTHWLRPTTRPPRRDSTTPLIMSSAKPLAPTKRNRGRPKRQQAADIEKELLALALQEFLQQGYGGASVSNIVRKAGMSKTTVYSRFASKEALFHAIIAQQIDKLSPAELLTDESGHHSLEEGLTNYANHMLSLSLKGELLGVNRLMYSESHRFPELGAAAAHRNRLGIKRIARFIRQCAAADDIPCRNPDGIAEIFIASIRGWYVTVLQSNRRVTAKQRQAWVEQCVSVLMASRSSW